MGVQICSTANRLILSHPFVHVGAVAHHRPLRKTRILHWLERALGLEAAMPLQESRTTGLPGESEHFVSPSLSPFC